MSKLIGPVVFVVILGLCGWIGVARWNECRRIHPFWYCASQK